MYINCRPKFNVDLLKEEAITEKFQQAVLEKTNNIGIGEESGKSWETARKAMLASAEQILGTKQGDRKD